MTTELTYTDHCIDDQVMSAEEAITRFYQNFPITRNMRVHDDYVTYEMPNERWAKEMLSVANDTISMLALPLEATAKRFGLNWILKVSYKNS